MRSTPRSILVGAAALCWAAGCRSDAEPGGGASGSAGVATGGAAVVASGGQIGASGSTADAAGRGGTFASGGTSNGGAGGKAGNGSTVRILAFGDSTTSSSCYRAKLWEKLEQGGFKSDFVGTQNADSGCTPSGYDRDHEGHPGILITNVGDAEMRQWCATNVADVALMHWGTNDVWSNKTVDSILAAYSKAVDALRMGNPNVVVLVAQIIPMNPMNTSSCTTCACAECPARVSTLNAAIPAWANSKSTTGSPIVVVNQWQGYDALADSNGDGVHPSTTTGSTKMANKWYDALVPFL